MPYLLKIILSVVLIVGITELTQRYGFWGSLLASLPLVSIISMIWIYTDTRDIQKISTFSLQVFWFVIPSLGLFLTLPWFLARYSFFISLGFASLVTVGLFLLMLGIFRFLDYDILN